MSLSSALSGIFTSLHNLFSSILATILALAQNILHALQSCLSGLVHLVRGVLTQVVRVTGGAGKFIASNIVALAVGGVLVMVYLKYAGGNRPVMVGGQTKTKTVAS
ncbi:uncharacterized protein CPUR_04000 [Claviceps purpurea 20.1]|uniref:Uncharacterized protein n=1 Tax=Claviceps purpurea (strain 20.1) TaxID=1111077 RepID=M1VVU9_CLAP2|nr:hypothetical protein E4U37_002742 [Claviceps purpurea]KAG6211787.1 hypothetical protein E4U50_002087 [Claviceps purpurea]CCE30152.1 uncharacterized protein CPUR_04000 [Claviceps purpurea 20.1]